MACQMDGPIRNICVDNYDASDDASVYFMLSPCAAVWNKLLGRYAQAHASIRILHECTYRFCQRSVRRIATRVIHF